MDLGLKDKVALVTGAGSQAGYGKGIALALAREGCDIIVGDINIEGAKQTVTEIQASGRRALAIGVDVRNRAEVDDMVKKGLEHFSKVDILVNNAGASSKMMPFIEMTKKDWDYDIGINLYGQMNIAQAILPHMISRKYGRIINISGGQGIPTLSIYGAAKAGVVMWTKALAQEVAPLGILVNVVTPGLGETGLTVSDPRLESRRQASPLKRLCTPEDVGRIVTIVASDACSFMVGGVVSVHGS